MTRACIPFALILAWTVLASADPTPSDRAAAEALFRDAKKLFASKQYAEACRKLEESQRLDPQGGTLLNLAVCHAREGRTASAWVEFQEAIDAAKKAKRADRVRLATRELAQLEKKLARLTVDVPSDARIPGLSIQRGGERVGEGAWGTAVPVDPGVQIEISVSAEGHKEWRTTVTVAAAEQKTLVVPRLEKLPPPPPKPKTATPAEEDRERRARARETGRLVAYVAGGVGLVGVGVGTYFGLSAKSRNDDAEKHCDGSLCDKEGLALNEQANRAATVSNIGFGVGVLGLGLGTYFFLASAPDAERKGPPANSSGVRLLPSIGPRSSGILMTGRW